MSPRTIFATATLAAATALAGASAASAASAAPVTTTAMPTYTCKTLKATQPSTGPNGKPRVMIVGSECTRPADTTAVHAMHRNFRVQDAAGTTALVCYTWKEKVPASFEPVEQGGGKYNQFMRKMTLLAYSCEQQ
ncbi:hypothetical protein [Streptomyces sp. NPDC054866]